MRPSAVVQGLPSAAIPQRLLLTISKGWPWPDPRLLYSWTFPKMAVPQVTMGSILKNTKRVIQSSMTCMIWGSTSPRGAHFGKPPVGHCDPVPQCWFQRFPAVPSGSHLRPKFVQIRHASVEPSGPWTWSWLPETLAFYQTLRKIIWGWVKTLVPLVNPKIAGKWMFIPLKMYL